MIRHEFKEKPVSKLVPMLEKAVLKFGESRLVQQAPRVFYRFFASMTPPPQADGT